MNRDARPRLREIFYSAERRPEVYFYTSNEEKFMQARLVFARAGLQLRHFPTHTDPYVEEYSLGTEGLLTRAVQQIASLTAGAVVFFVEDTSVRIEALSGSTDVPGLRVKEWFSETSFDALDAELKSRGNAREAVVKSDIALHLPGLARPIFFHGEVAGRVADAPPGDFQSPQYPWLTSKTFNGWFVPDGAAKRLGEMSLEQSWQYDFRVRSLLGLIERIEEYTTAMNLPVNAYIRRRRPSASGQLPLLPKSRRVVVVVGKTCAGKSVFGSQASNVSFSWVEASDIVRGFQQEHGSPSQPIGEFAKEYLARNGADVVARRVLQLMEGDPDVPVVISGFRTLEELELVKREIPECEIVLVESSERTRFGRYVERARPGASSKIADFRSIDAAQWGLGLLAVAEDFADIRITNEGTLDEYFGQIGAVLSGLTESVVGVSKSVVSGRLSERSQLVRCLKALAIDGRSMDCHEISLATTLTGASIRFNNVNKILKRYPALAQRFDMKEERVRYKITESGRAYLRMIESPIFVKGKKVT
jgi:inosine/xanthosine triphosphate pyrophosphatase family protein/dephospho-CoA kinase